MGNVVKTLNGKLSGFETENAYIFRGVPYAKPPTNNLRFAAPQKCDPWDGVLDATKFPKRAMQKEFTGFYKKEFFYGEYHDSGMSEDCLYLNIWAPKDMSAGSKYPVAVWIHGGRFLGGYGFEREFDGEEYTKRGVILVTINYRLGMFGFFAHPELTKRDGHSGNYGLLDQIAAIDWVRENIAAFGGNRSDITVFGQSAGGYSVRCLASSPLAKGKFQKAIIQSCGGYHGTIMKEITMEQVEKVCAAYLKKHKLNLEALMQLPEERVLELSARFLLFGIIHGGRLFSLVPCIDNWLLTGDIDGLVDNNETMTIPYMAGCTKNDILVSRKGVKDRQDNRLYNGSVGWCVEHSKRGTPSYSYYFSREVPGGDGKAFHTSELWYMFGTLDRCWRPMTDRDRALSKEMVDCWTDFMKTGDPGWHPCTKDNPYAKEFN